jgi:hypothetical protein
MARATETISVRARSSALQSEMGDWDQAAECKVNGVLQCGKDA